MQADQKKEAVECWRRFQYPGDLYAERREAGSWRPHTHLQDPALFLQEEADMAATQPVYEIEHTDVPGTLALYEDTVGEPLPSSVADPGSEFFHPVSEFFPSPDAPINFYADRDFYLMVLRIWMRIQVTKMMRIRINNTG